MILNDKVRIFYLIDHNQNYFPLLSNLRFLYPKTILYLVLLNKNDFSSLKKIFLIKKKKYEMLKMSK